MYRVMALAAAVLVGPALLATAFLVADQFELNLFHIGDAA